MRKRIVLALAAVVIAGAIPAADYVMSRPIASESPLTGPLRQYGFVPIAPPSNLMELGSLYYVDAAVREFSAICHPRKEDLKDLIVVSRGGELQEDLERNARFSTDITVDFLAEISGDGGGNYVHRVHWTLTNVELFELPLGDARLIFAKLMERPECNEEALRHVRAGGYVCQGQKILSGTAEFKLDHETQRQLVTKGKVSADRINGLVKGAVEARGEHTVVERRGRLFAGEELKYGVKMNPLCVAPVDGRFARELPRSLFGRVKNFVLFQIVEPMLPVKETRVASAEPVGN